MRVGYDVMKEILIRLLFAAFLTFAAFALSSSARGQKTELGAVEQTAHEETASVQSQPSPETQLSAVVLPRDDDQTQDALVFTGQIQRESGSLVLLDPVTRVRYQLDDPARAKLFTGQEVRVVGKLEMRSNTILIQTITPWR